MNKQTFIHPTAIVDKNARIGSSCHIGPFSIIGEKVEICDNVEVKSHAVIEGRTRIGEGCIIYPFVTIGAAPQDLKYKGEDAEVIIGSNNTFREHVTVHIGTETGNMVTKIGNGCLFMIGTHIAHDCIIGNNVIMANNATLAGHVEVGDNTIIGGLVGIHQFVKIGESAMIGGVSGIERDVIPFGMAYGSRASLRGLNLLGLKRRNFPQEEILRAIEGYKMLFLSEGSLEERVIKVREKFAASEIIAKILIFIENAGKRSICMPQKEI